MGNSFFERYMELCKSAGETPNSVAKMIGASSGSVTAWKNGTEPRYSTISKIADHFKVSADYLLGKESKKASTDFGERDILDEVDIGFYNGYRDLDEADKEVLRDMVRIMRERKSKRDGRL